MFTKEKQNSLTSQDSNVLLPITEKEVADIIKKSYKSNAPIEIVGSNSKRQIGKQLQCSKTLSLSKLNGIIEYLPSELYIKVKAGTQINEIESELNKYKQCLHFEPIDFGYLFSGKSNFGTAGGQVACNISGPRRFKSGSVRDHILGFKAVNGRGEIIKSGGTVVKNVTGYDLSKLMCGSYGTLAALTEITFKVMPIAEETKTLAIHNLDLERAIVALDLAVRSSNEISGATFLPVHPLCNKCEMNIEKTFKLNDLKEDGSITAIRLEGPKKSIQERLVNLNKEMKISNYNISILDSLQSEIFWKKIKNLEFFSATKNNVFRIVIPSSECVQLINELPKNFKFYIDWGGALIWMEACDLSEQLFDSIRKKVVRHEGYISMIKNSNFLPFVEDVFTINIDKFNLSQNIKKSFDPKRILNPGKMYTGI